MLRKHMIAYIMPNLAQAIASFGTVAVLTRLLTDAEYGRFSLIFTTMTIVHYIFLTWTEAAAARFYAKAESENNVSNHFKTILTTYVVNVALFAVAATVLGFLYPGDNHVKIALAAAFAGSVVRSLLKIALETRRMNLQAMHFAFVESFHIIIGFIITILCVWKLGLKEEGPFIATMVAAAMALIIEAPFLIKLSKNGKYQKDLVGEYLKFGYGISGGLLLTVALNTGDRYFIAYFLNDAAVGAYSAGYQTAARIMDILFVYIASANFPILLSAFEKGTKEEFQQAARNSFNIRIALGMPAAFGIALVAYPLSEILIGESLREQAARITPYIAFAGLFIGLSDYFSDAFLIAKKVFERALIMLIPAILNMILNVILLPPMGLDGAVIATLLSYAVGLIILGVRSRKYVKMPLPIADTAKVLGACLLMCATVTIAGKLGLEKFGGFVELITKASIGGVTYICAAIILNFADSRRFIFKILNKFKHKAAL